MPNDRSDLIRYIYVLIDPRDSVIRYVGCAVDVDKRLKEHLRIKATLLNANG